MIDVTEVLRRRAAGRSMRKIARETGTGHGTVARYVAVAEALPLPRAARLRRPRSTKSRSACKRGHFLTRAPSGKTWVRTRSRSRTGSAGRGRCV